VPEVWRLEGDSLTFLSLDAAGRYVAGPSRSFPQVTPADLLTFLRLSRQAGDQNVVMRQFREWAGRRQAGGPPSA
jgi:hypothetical protein